MKKDIRKEQLALLRLEKKIAGVAAALAGAAAAAASAKAKLGTDSPEIAFAEIQSALTQLADVTTKAHESINNDALALGADTFQAWGVPKPHLSTAVRSLLGIG